MQIDVPTLYVLTAGTLCLAAAMTLWERKAQPRRARELGIWSAGYAMLAAGCLVMMNRDQFAGVTGAVLTNILFLFGYLTVLHGAARLDGRRFLWASAALLVVVVIAWLTLGARFPQVFWHHVSSIPVALISGAIAWVLARSRATRGLRSRPLAVAISAGHSLFYLGRAILMPVIAANYGSDALKISAMATMFEAVLYSIAMPMTFLALVREEAQCRLLTVSQTDYLTGLSNRHALFERGARILAEGRADRPVSLLAFDLDHFKSINDRHGHAAGDEVLKLFAGVAREAVGTDAVLARLGGEEFAALLPGSNAETAQTIGESVCRRFAQEAARDDGLSIHATVSIGIAQSGPDRRDLPAILSAADRALYRAKSLGRNRVVADGVAVAA